MAFLFVQALSRNSRLRRNSKHFWIQFGLAFSLLTISVSTTPAQQPSRVRSGFDTINLKTHEQLKGVLLDANANEELKIAVSREWLRRTDANAYAKIAKQAEVDEQRANIQLRDRLKQLNTRDQHPAFDFFVKKELERIESVIDSPTEEESQFLVLKIKRTQVASLSMAMDANRRIALWGWFERLAKIESREVSDIAKELKSRDPAFDAANPAPDLSSRLPIMEQTEDEWTIRIAILAYGLSKRIEFQGTGAVMIQVNDDKQPPDLSALLVQMLQLQTSSVIGDLTGKVDKSPSAPRARSPWMNAAISKTEQQKEAYFRATHVQLDPLGENASVESVFMVKLPNDEWRTVWKRSHNELASQQAAAAMGRVMRDPQLASLAKTLQVIPGASESMEKAIRFGAATLTAQSAVNDQFGEFIGKYLRRLDTPPL